MVTITGTASGRTYRVDELHTGYHQYLDRLYQFQYVPEELVGCVHIMTYGDDKMICEDDWCFSIEVDRPCQVYIIYPDKQPQLPNWMDDYTRTRMNLTRMDSSPGTLKGYFSLYRKDFPAGQIRFNGNSPRCMLDQDWYVETGGNTYCMYTVVVKEL